MCLCVFFVLVTSLCPGCGPLRPCCQFQVELTLQVHCQPDWEQQGSCRDGPRTSGTIHQQAAVLASGLVLRALSRLPSRHRDGHLLWQRCVCGVRPRRAWRCAPECSLAPCEAGCQSRHGKRLRERVTLIKSSRGRGHMVSRLVLVLYLHAMSDHRNHHCGPMICLH